MSIYKLKKEEIEEIHNEFNKTDFGKRAKIFSMIPFFSGYICLLMLFIVTIGGAITNSEESIFSPIVIVLLSLAAMLCFSIGAIRQLQYGKMLKEYVESKK